MKQLLVTLFLFVLTICPTLAISNYPYRSDYLWVTVPDHADWLYKAGEKARVDVQLYKYGIPRDAVVEYTIGGDCLPDDEKGSVNLKNGRAVINMGTSRTPGFRDLRLSATVDGVTYYHHVKVGFDVDKIRPLTKEPAGFRDFWERALAENEKFPVSFTKEPAPEYSNDKVDAYLLKIFINKQKQAFYGYLLMPRNAQPGSCPVVLTPPGAGVKTIKRVDDGLFYSESGCVRLMIDIHGIDPRLPEATFGEIRSAFERKDNGYLYMELDNPERYYMYRVYTGLVKCIDLLTSLPEWDGRNVIVQGGSQGGALSLVAAALDKRITLCVANHPALSDMAASAKGKTGGYPHFKNESGAFTPEKINTMAYYDVVNFAPYIKAQTFLTWGYNDNVCPPTTSYAVWNTLTCPKESLLTPVNEHWTSEATDRTQLDWILSHLK